jgi:hypothetical protein
MADWGLLGTGDWATDERPKSWRDGILYLNSNGSAPLTALTSKMPTSKVDDPEHNWWEKILPTQSVSVTGVYTNLNLSSAYADSGVAGDVLYLKMAAADVTNFRKGHVVLMRDASKLDVDVVGKINGEPVVNGASSYIPVTLKEADDNGATTDLSDCDTVKVIGNANPEASLMPSAIHYPPSKRTNYAQIFRTPLDISRTARLTHLRTGDAYKVLKRECLELHAIEQEYAYIYGIPDGTSVGSNGKPERLTGGLRYFIKTYAASDNVNDFVVQESATWASKGEQWLDERCAYIFKYGSNHKVAFCGSGALEGINRIAKLGGQINLTPQSRSYGLKVVEWATPAGVIDLIRHPLFSHDATDWNAMIIFEPRLLRFRYISDTTFGKDKDAGAGYIGYDGTREGYLTEALLEIQHSETGGYLTSVGVDGA